MPKSSKPHWPQLKLSKWPLLYKVSLSKTLLFSLDEQERASAQYRDQIEENRLSFESKLQSHEDRHEQAKEITINLETELASFSQKLVLLEVENESIPSLMAKVDRLQVTEEMLKAKEATTHAMEIEMERLRGVENLVVSQAALVAELSAQLHSLRSLEAKLEEKDCTIRDLRDQIQALSGNAADLVAKELMLVDLREKLSALEAKAHNQTSAVIKYSAEKGVAEKRLAQVESDLRQQVSSLEGKLVCFNARGVIVRLLTSYTRLQRSHTRCEVSQNLRFPCHIPYVHITDS